MKKMTVITLLLAAAICSACGNTNSPESALQPDTVTASVTLPAPESDPDKKSETDSETAPEETAALTDDRKSETKDTTIETEDSEIENTNETSETTETTAEKATTTSKAVTSSATTTTKKATTTTKAVAQTTTTTKKAATTTTTAKQATTTTTTTTKKQEQPAQQASSVEWTPLMRAYQHYREATLDVRDDMDKYDTTIFTDAEVELIRKDICDYGLKNFNGKQVVTLHTENGIKTLDFLRPLELTVDTTLYCYQQGSFVLGDAHLNCAGGQGGVWIPKKQYLAMSDEEKYNVALEDMQGAHELMENALYRWYDYAGQAYAYIMTYNFGIVPSGSYWLLTK